MSAMQFNVVLKFEADRLKDALIMMINQGRFDLTILLERLEDDVLSPSLLQEIEVAIMKAETGSKSEDPDRDIVSKIAMRLEFEEDQKMREQEIADRMCAKELQDKERQSVQEIEARKHAKRLQIVKLQDEIAEAQNVQEIADLECVKKLQIAEFRKRDEMKRQEMDGLECAKKWQAKEWEESDRRLAENQASEDLAKQLACNIAPGAANVDYKAEIYRNIQTSSDGTQFSAINGQTYVFCKCGSDFCTGEKVYCGIFRCFVSPGVQPDISHPMNRMQHGSNKSAVLAMDEMRKRGIIVFGCGQQYDCRNPMNPVRSDGL